MTEQVNELQSIENGNTTDSATRAEINAVRLLERFAKVEQCVVAYSGGVDSAVVAAAAYRACGQRAEAVMSISPSVPRRDRVRAQATAASIGISFQTIETQEFSSADYTKNDARRCYFCKSELYERMQQLVRSYPNAIIFNGTNADDLGDYRPGLEAASEHGIQSPLAELGITKAEVRAMARYWQLDVSEKPASPCLSSRVAYGEEVTPERLQMIDCAENYLEDLGFSNHRVRYHGGDLARIEIDRSQMPQMLEQSCFDMVQSHLLSLGFRFVTLDMGGYRSGSLNSLVQIQSQP